VDRGLIQVDPQPFQRRGWVTARDIYRARAVCDRKATLDQIRVLMRELVTMGLAITQNEGNRLEIQAVNRGDSSLPAGIRISSQIHQCRCGDPGDHSITGARGRSSAAIARLYASRL
jgi:hypothetical protein